LRLQPSFARLFVLTAALLAGCTSLSDLKTDISERVFGREELNPPAPLVEFQPTAAPKLLWSSKVGSAETYDFSPVADSNAVYAASAQGELLKLDAANGKEVWRVRADERFSAGVGLGANLVLVGTPTG
jgi:outer membrane protein assembly factor BamB